MVVISLLHQLDKQLCDLLGNLYKGNLLVL